MKLSELAAKLGLPYNGNPDHIINGVGDIEHISPVYPDRIYYIASAKYKKRFAKAQDVQCALTTEKLSGSFPQSIITTEDQSRLSFIKILEIFEKKPEYPAGISPRAFVHPEAVIGKNATIMDFAFIGQRARIGDRCVIFPNAVVEPDAMIGDGTVLKSGVVIGYNCRVGRDNVIHANAVIGADGFGFYDKNNVRYKIPQIGNVIIGDCVELGAHCTIDRATIESTTVGDHTKFDDHVHIGHNCRVGKYVYIAGATVLAGSVVIEDYVIMGGQSAVAEHAVLKKGSAIMGLTGISKETKAGVTYFGIPGRPAIEAMRLNGFYNKLPEIHQRLTRVEEELGKRSPKA